MNLFALADSGALALIFQLILSPLVYIAAYILSSIGLYTIAKRRGLHQPWLAWVPVANIWLLGSLSDQYQYVVSGKHKAKRKVLLTLNILVAVVELVFAAVLICAVVQLIFGITGGYSEDYLVGSFLSSALGMVGLLVPLLGLRIARAVVRYIALYDVFKSLDPANAVMFLVLSILFRVTEPFFLCCNRDKELGMPPRKAEPAAPVEPFPQSPEAEEA